MSIITISRGCYSHGKQIAEKVAGILGYECISREILIDASQYFHVSEKELLKSIHDAPSILEKLTHGREKYIAYIRAALLDRIQKDNVVYHGHAGHLLIPELPHLLKVRVVADMKERIKFLRHQQSMSARHAHAFLVNEDKQRSRWTHYLYGVDAENSMLYDLVINIGGLRLDDACEVIVYTTRMETFKSTPESRKWLSDLAITSHVQAALQDVCSADVSTKNGIVSVRVNPQKIRRTDYASPKALSELKEQVQMDLDTEVTKIAQGVPGVKDVVTIVEAPRYS